MIELRNVSFSFENEPALDSISLSIGSGSFVVLAGANGCGKTTLLRLCNGLLEPDEGTVLINGSDIQNHPIAGRTGVGMVFQNPRDCFVSATIGEDVAFGPRNLGLDHAEIDRRVERALKAVRMEGRRSERIDRLSGGEQSRVAIAGALAMEPDHLALDEPFVGLDKRTRETVIGYIKNLIRTGTGILMATHDLRDVWSIADRIIGLEDGSIVLDDAPRKASLKLEKIGVRTPCSCEKARDGG